MKYVIYLAVAVLILWAVIYLARHIRRQMKGDCGCCGGGCSGDCSSCGPACPHKPPKT